MPDTGAEGRPLSRSTSHDDVDGTPCTRQDDHDGDHENWYAQRTWKAT